MRGRGARPVRMSQPSIWMSQVSNIHVGLVWFLPTQISLGAQVSTEMRAVRRGGGGGGEWLQATTHVPARGEGCREGNGMDGGDTLLRLGDSALAPSQGREEPCCGLLREHKAERR